MAKHYFQKNVLCSTDSDNYDKSCHFQLLKMRLTVENKVSSGIALFIENKNQFYVGIILSVNTINNSTHVQI